MDGWPSGEHSQEGAFFGGSGAGVRIHMAFGFGFNKQKVLSAAEKFVQQGKLQNAIAEYEKVLKADPKDLTVNNTVGDLYARLGQNERALECFKSVGDAYAAQGFTVKAIAMYKKLTKIKPTLEGILRLAELYTQQGLFNDARAQYLQVAEEFLRSGQLEQAVRIFQKTLEMDPENVSMRMRLAEVYVRMGKKTEAWQIFASAAESLRSRSQLAGAEEILQRMLTLDPENSYALLMRGRNAFDSGDVTTAVAYLEKVSDLDSHPDGMRSLLQAYLQTGRFAEAGTLAAKLFTVHNDSGAITSYSDALASAGRYDEALEIYSQYADRLLAADSGKVLESLHSIIGHVRENTKALETVLEILNKAGESTHVTEIYELLAHAFVQSGQLEKARDFYLKLTQLEPQNQLHARNYQQVITKLGGPAGVHLITAEEGAVLVDELEATAPSIDQRYPDDVALAVRAALTDAELFVSYNMAAKALGPLMSVLPLAPMDLRLNQRLVALHTRASRFTEAAVCCRNLQTLYHEARHPDEATRYGELAAMYEERAALTASSISAGATEVPHEIVLKGDRIPPFESTSDFDIVPEAETVPAVSKAPAEPAPKAKGLFFHAPPPAIHLDELRPPSSADFEVHAVPEGEIDLSEEWEGGTDTPPTSVLSVTGHLEAEAGPVDEVAVAEAIEEIRFYLMHTMVDQAQEAFVKLATLKNDPVLLSAMRAEIEAAISRANNAPAEPVVEDISVDEDPVPEVAMAMEDPMIPEPQPETLDEFVNELESSLGADFLATSAEPVQEHVPPSTPEPEPQRELVAQAEVTAEPVQGEEFGEFVADLDATLGDSFLPETSVKTTPQAWPHAPAPSQPFAHAEVEHAAEVSAPQVAATATGSGAAAAFAPALEAAAASTTAPSLPPSFTYEPTKIRPLDPLAAASTTSFDSSAGVDLADMFGDLKHELEEDAASSDEDPETHYNLGVAFREMGLLDEAIGELQKVCQAVERGHTFPQIMQTYTWLAQCFLDKGVPEAAIRWYESALKLPNIDQDTRIALHYELGTSYDAAQNKPAALQHFMNVYGSNIDYRDVSERIKALKS